MTEQKKLQFFYITGTADKLRGFIPYAIERIARDLDISAQNIEQGINLDVIFQKIIEAMSKIYTEEEIDTTIAFYDSKIGRSMAEKESTVAIKIAEIINDDIMLVAKQAQKSDSLKN